MQMPIAAAAAAAAAAHPDAAEAAHGHAASDAPADSTRLQPTGHIHLPHQPPPPLNPLGTGSSSMMTRGVVVPPWLQRKWASCQR